MYKEGDSCVYTGIQMDTVTTKMSLCSSITSEIL